MLSKSLHKATRAHVWIENRKTKQPLDFNIHFLHFTTISVIGQCFLTPKQSFNNEMKRNPLDLKCMPNIILKKGKPSQTFLVQLGPSWCGQQDLNLHEPNAHKNLNLARLPIPPCPHSFAILAYPKRNVNSFGQFGQNVVNFQKYRPSRRLSSQKNNLDCNNAILHLQHERNHKSTFEKRFYIVCTF